MTTPFLAYPTASPVIVSGVMHDGQDGDRFVSVAAAGESFSLVFEASGDGFELNATGELRSFDYLGHECVDWAGSVTIEPAPAWRLALDVACVENPLIRLIGEWRAVVSADST